MISWNSMLQKTIALSSTQAEYQALKEATKEALYLNNIYKYIGKCLEITYIKDSIPTIYIDNEGARKLAENPEFHKKSKHIEIIYHFTREAVKNKHIILKYIPSKKQLADWLTKNVPGLLHKDLLL